MLDHVKDYLMHVVIITTLILWQYIFLYFNTITNGKLRGKSMNDFICMHSHDQCIILLCYVYMNKQNHNSWK